MARIRTVKPSFYRHGGLQDLEAAHSGAYVMLVFQGLWSHCDKRGVFLWDPRELKLDILPYLTFDMAATLCLLESAGYVVRYDVGPKVYGWIPTFLEHQRITGKELQEPAKYPPPPGINGDTLETQPGGQEGKGVQEREREEAERARLLADFERFWLMYPRKVKKDHALAEWLKRSPDVELVTVILGALSVHKASTQWTKDGGEFIPHPRTWLHQARWQDEPARVSGIGIQGVDIGPSAEMRRNMERYADLNATPMTPREVEEAKQALAGKPQPWRNGGTA